MGRPIKVPRDQLLPLLQKEVQEGQAFGIRAAMRIWDLSYPSAATKLKLLSLEGLLALDEKSAVAYGCLLYEIAPQKAKEEPVTPVVEKVSPLVVSKPLAAKPAPVVKSPTTSTLSTKKLSHREFCIEQIRAFGRDFGMKGGGKGVHVVYNKFNETFRRIYKEEPVPVVERLIREGFLVKKSSGRGITIFLASELSEADKLKCAKSFEWQKKSPEQATTTSSSVATQSSSPSPGSVSSAHSEKSFDPEALLKD
jgi:hypothetical protein